MLKGPDLPLAATVILCPQLQVAAMAGALRSVDQNPLSKLH